MLFAGHGSHHTHRATNDDAGDGSSPTRGASLMDPGDPKAVLQVIVGTWQAHDVITPKQSHGEIVGDVTKMFKRLRKRSQRCKIIPYLCQMSKILFLDMLTAVLRLIG